MRERFPNNEDRRSFRILRKLSRPSRASLLGVGECAQAFPRHDIRVKPVGEAALTLVGKGTIMNGRSRTEAMREMLFSDLAMSILRPEPESARYPHLFKSAGIAEFGRVRAGHELFEPSLALVLHDPGGMLEEEHNTYLERLSKIGDYYVAPQGFEPHITLMRVDPTCITSDLLCWLERRIPDEVMLLPVGTDPRLPN